MKTFHALLLSLMVLVGTDANGEEATEGYRLDQTNWGEPVAGAVASEVKPEDMSGKLVIIEEFGVKIPACLERLKALARLHKRFERDKTAVVIIGIHRQREVPDEEIAAAAKKERVEFVLRKNGFLPASIGGMPHAGIYLPDGRLFWHGDSTAREFEKQLRDALKLASAPAGEK